MRSLGAAKTILSYFLLITFSLPLVYELMTQVAKQFCKAIIIHDNVISKGGALGMLYECSVYYTRAG